MPRSLDIVFVDNSREQYSKRCLNQTFLDARPRARI
jgi:hypothetical protein